MKVGRNVQFCVVAVRPPAGGGHERGNGRQGEARRIGVVHAVKGAEVANYACAVLILWLLKMGHG